MLTPDQIKLLKSSAIYKKYGKKDWGSLSISDIETDLDNIPTISLETLPIIWFLTQIHNSKLREDMDDELTALDNDSGVIQKWTTARFGRLGHDEGLKDATNYDIIQATITLSTGTVTNAVIAPKASGYKIQLAFIIWRWDTAPSTSYTMSYHEEDQSALDWHVLLPEHCGKKMMVCFATSSAVNKDLMVDIAGGGGSEKLVSTAICCYF